MEQNHRIVLAARPDGAPTPADFRAEKAPIPQPRDGELLLRTQYLSLDPYMRGRMSDGPSYAPPIGLGEVMVGGTVSRVAVSRNDRFAAGDLVLASAGWQEFAISDGSGLVRLDGIAHPSHALSVLGMPGFTAYHGLLNIGKPRPGETVVVGSASGAVGSVVGQIARLKGARAVGIAGGADKCRFVVEELGFDACINRYAPDFAQQLARACPDGIDVYFEGVGGAVFDAVLPLLNDYARVPVSGFIAHYNEKDQTGSRDRMPALLAALVYKRVRIEGFIILDHYADGLAAFQRDMGEWVASSQVKIREQVVDGLENAPAALVDLLAGRNFGKVVVRVGA